MKRKHKKHRRIVHHRRKKKYKPTLSQEHRARIHSYERTYIKPSSLQALRERLRKEKQLYNYLKEKKEIERELKILRHPHRQGAKKTFKTIASGVREHIKKSQQKTKPEALEPDEPTIKGFKKGKRGYYKPIYGKKKKKRSAPSGIYGRDVFGNKIDVSYLGGGF